MILDLMMPDMTGKQCLEELAKINPQVKCSLRAATLWTRPLLRRSWVVQRPLCIALRETQFLLAMRKVLDTNPI